MTSRQGIEIPFIKLEDIDVVKKELDEVGLQPGACGPRVRTVTACQGGAICPSGLIDTTALARELDGKYFAMDLPHKFKFGITGCLNNCLKAEENDLGIKGGMKPVWQEEQCSFCGLCAAVCPTKAVKVEKQEKKISFIEKDCIYCGKCVKSCPVEAWRGQSGFLVYFGGMFGNRIATGQQLLPIIFSKDNLLKAIDITLGFFKKHGKQGERFRNTLDRVDWELLQKELEVI
jgi:anaerobic sulfite reductase subunit C